MKKKKAGAMKMTYNITCWKCKAVVKGERPYPFKKHKAVCPKCKTTNGLA